MLKPVLISMWPGFVALAIGCALLVLLVKLSGAKWNLARLRELNRCQQGGVQSLAFVLTLPLFLMVLMFVTQVSQLMIGVMTVNYAAYAGARAATVWIPEDFGLIDAQLESNEMHPPIGPGSPYPLLGTSPDLVVNPKYERTFRAVALALAPICPSRSVGYQIPPMGEPVAEMAEQLHYAVAPSARSNPRTRDRIRNKLAYAYNQTAVVVSFEDFDVDEGPTYNPPVTIIRDNQVEVTWDPHEVSWQSPVTVFVEHHFALLPGPGRFLAKQIVRADGRRDEVSPRIKKPDTPGDVLYTTKITATCTMTNEGLRSVNPYYRIPYQ